MKTSIIITGQLNSVSTLKRAIATYDCKVVELPFNNFELQFQTKKQAIKALSAGYRDLISDWEDWKNSCASYCYGISMSYDAATAKIRQS